MPFGGWSTVVPALWRIAASSGRGFGNCSRIHCDTGLLVSLSVVVRLDMPPLGTASRAASTLTACTDSLSRGACGRLHAVALHRGYSGTVDVPRQASFRGFDDPPGAVGEAFEGESGAPQRLGGLAVV